MPVLTRSCFTCRCSPTKVAGNRGDLLIWRRSVGLLLPVCCWREGEEDGRDGGPRSCYAVGVIPPSPLPASLLRRSAAFVEKEKTGGPRSGRHCHLLRRPPPREASPPLTQACINSGTFPRLFPRVDTDMERYSSSLSKEGRSSISIEYSASITKKTNLVSEQEGTNVSTNKRRLKKIASATIGRASARAAAMTAAVGCHS
nr:hypothetical protein Iba_scaffold3049CG0140 [Ipomoea batatas]